MPSQGSHPTSGLRARKKARTRAAIQAEALRLFRELGYDATTMTRIAEAAEVSESTLFRYFPTKEELVLGDDSDPVIVEAFKAQPATLTPLQALRAAFRSFFAGLSIAERTELQERIELIHSVPALRAGMLDQFAATMHLLGEVVGERVQRPADDFAVRTLAGAVVGAAMAVMFAMADDPAADVEALFDDAMARLETGLSL